MRKLTVTLCLTLAVLLGSEVRGSDLPLCEEVRRKFVLLPITLNGTTVVHILLVQLFRILLATNTSVNSGMANLTDRHLYPFIIQTAGEKYVGEFRNGNYHGKAPIPMPMVTNTGGEFGMAERTDRVPIPGPMVTNTSVNSGMAERTYRAPIFI